MNNFLKKIISYFSMSMLILMMVSCTILPSTNVTESPTQIVHTQTTDQPTTPIINTPLTTDEPTPAPIFQIPTRLPSSKDAENITPDDSFTVFLCSELHETNLESCFSLKSINVINIEALKATLFNKNDDVEETTLLSGGQSWKQGGTSLSEYKGNGTDVSTDIRFSDKESSEDVEVDYNKSLQLAYDYVEYLLGSENIKNIRLDSYRAKSVTHGENTSIVAYNFKFGNTYGDIPVSALYGNNFLRVYVNGNYITEISMKWEKFEKADEYDIVLTKSEDALALVLENMREYDDYYAAVNPVKIIDVQLAYSSKVANDGSYRLVWEFIVEDQSSIHVDVCSKIIFNPLNPK